MQGSDPMAYEPYVTSDYYKDEYGGTIVPEEQLAKALRQASRHIDTLTYNRIVGRGKCRHDQYSTTEL